MTYERSREVSCDRFCGIIASALAMGVLSSLIATVIKAGSETLPEVIQVAAIIVFLMATIIAVICTLTHCANVCCYGSDEERDELLRDATDTYLAWSIADALFDDD